MDNETPEFETPSASSKDMWLFLIVLDVIVLCVLGFFLYNHFSARVLTPSAPVPAVAVQTVEEQPNLEETVVTETDVIQEEEVAAPVQEFLAPEEKQMSSVPDVSVEPEPTAIETASETKQSILVLPAANGSKYRRVTFRWFEPAETVSIVSGFTNRKPQALKKVGDYWETTLSIAPGTYKFLYIIDGKNTLDPYADQKDGRSVLVVK